MKKKLLILVLLLSTIQITANAQRKSEFGNTLNLGLGIGYYGYGSMPVIHGNYEFDVARNFTIAPFLSLSTYSNNYFWGTGRYGYRETTVAFGGKGSYYFDELFEAGGDWDFYAGGSIGAAVRSVKWDAGYNGDRYAYRRSGSPLFLDLHIGAEYHFNDRIGMFLDLSSGVSTVGIAIH